jgi:hypothetical protein
MRISRWTAVLAAPVVAAAVVVSAHANMFPEAIHVVHVQPWGGSDLTCGEPPPALTCSDLSTLTDATGMMVFDLLIYSTVDHYTPDSHLRLDGVEMTLTWPEAWKLRDWTRCSMATGVLRATPDTSGATLRLQWSTSPEFLTELLPIARIQLLAPTPGNLDAQGEGTVSTDRVQEPFQIYLGGRARVGVECGDCAGSCYGTSDCAPLVSVDRLTMHVPPQRSAEADFRIEIFSGVGPGGCTAPLEVASTLDWIGFGIEALGWPNWRVRVRADAASVAAGSYETWIRCHTICTSCVALTVIVDADPPAAEEASWGAVKARYRIDR